MVAAAGLILDLWSKDWALQRLRQDQRITIIPHVLDFQTMFNPGALFGIGAGQTTVFLIASVLALGLVLVMFAQSSPRRWIVQIALGAIFAGAIGNMYDRLTVELVEAPIRAGSNVVMRKFEKVVDPAAGRVLLYEYPRIAESRVLTLPISEAEKLREIGYVRDFIKINSTIPGWGEIWPWVFNVADMLLVGGVSILAVRILFERRTHAHRESAPAAHSAPAGPA